MYVYPYIFAFMKVLMEALQSWCRGSTIHHLDLSLTAQLSAPPFLRSSPVIPTQDGVLAIPDKSQAAERKGHERTKFLPSCISLLLFLSKVPWSSHRYSFIIGLNLVTLPHLSLREIVKFCLYFGQQGVHLKSGHSKTKEEGENRYQGAPRNL